LLERALDELEDWERILLLQRACETPYKNISELTGKPEDQLKVYHKRVLSKLCRKLEELQKMIKVQ
jgi:DNA-directed RNA polymerase specialized sigma24 family protein